MSLAGRWRTGQSLSLLCFAVLAAVAKRPMTVPQIAKALQTGRDAVAKSMKALEELGWVIKRADNRWAMRVILAPVAIPLPNTFGKLPELQHAEQGTEPVLGPNLIKGVPDDPRLNQSQAHYRTNTPTEDAETRARKLAAAWKVPMTIEGVGRIGLGMLGTCSRCHEQKTPLHYGGKVICAKCARGGTDV